jgi:hypothetical protein
MGSRRGEISSDSEKSVSRATPLLNPGLKFRCIVKDKAITELLTGRRVGQGEGTSCEVQFFSCEQYTT